MLVQSGRFVKYEVGFFTIVLFKTINLNPKYLCESQHSIVEFRIFFCCFHYLNFSHFISIFNNHLFLTLNYSKCTSEDSIRSIVLTMIENNLKYQREHLEKENLNNARQQSSTTKGMQKHDAKSFEYAIRPDGTVLAEVLWKKRKREGQPYQFVDESSIRKLSSSLPPAQRQQLYLRSTEISLAKIEGLIKNSMIEHKRLTSLPPEPKTTKPTKNTSSLSCLAPVQSSSTSSFPSAGHLENPQKNVNDTSQRNSYNNEIIRENDQNGINRRQTMKQTNPTPSPFYSNHSYENAGPSSSSNKSATTTQKPKTVDSVDDDEFDDDVFNDFDVDQVISEHKSNTISSSRAPATLHNAPQRFDAPSRDHSFNYQPPDSESQRSNHVDYNSNGGGESSFRNNTFQQQQQYSKDIYSGSSYENNSNNNNNTFGGSNDYGSSINNNLFGGNGNKFDTQQNFSYGDTNGGDAPLCPGHGLPCRLLTANTSINMGREFYKCSLPEGQSCEFFQWKDGMEGNWNENHGGMGGNMDRGQVLDMHEENRRVFGHRSFRKGQKDVIEQAIQGKDVFVLMPTG